MGTWGVDAFENDTANDWAYDLLETNDLSFVESTLDTVISNSSNYIDANIACEALAACEVIARSNGKFGKIDAYTENVDEWVQSVGIKPSSALVSKASNVIDKILGEKSELVELWDGDEEWLESVANLKSRLYS